MRVHALADSGALDLAPADDILITVAHPPMLPPV